MRRKDREVSNIEEIENIIKNCKICHLAMIDDNKPYVVPVNFGYEINKDTLTLFFHSAKMGKKIDILNKNSSVCFEMCVLGEIVNDENTPCNSGCYFDSVIGSGHVEFITDVDEKCRALSSLMKHQVDADVKFNEKQANSAYVLKIETKDFTGKSNKPPVK